VGTKFSIDPFSDGVGDADANGKYAEIEFTFSSADTVRTAQFSRGGKMGFVFS
jgi:hypothetical protein